METSEIQLEIIVSEPDGDDEQLDTITNYLIDDLREFDLESIGKLSEREIPKGAKGDSFTIGALALVAIPSVIPSLVTFLQACGPTMPAAILSCGAV